MGALFPSLILAALGILIIVWVAKAMLSPIIGRWGSKSRSIPLPLNIPAWLFRRKLNKKVYLIKRAEELLSAKQPKLALDRLEDAFFLEHVKISQDAVSLVYRHNLIVLNKAVGILRQHRAKLANLALIEELFLTRNELMEKYIETEMARRNISKKRAKKGKTTPRWGTEELANQAESIKEKIFTNKYALKKELAKMFSEVSEHTKGAEITYH